MGLRRHHKTTFFQNFKTTLSKSLLAIVFLFFLKSGYATNDLRKEIWQQAVSSSKKELLSPQIEPFLASQEKISKEEKSYPYQLAIGALFRNEAPYLKEWIEFHLLVGVEHFFLYNHLSDDDFLTILRPYIDQKIVEVIDWNYPFEDKSHQQWIEIQCSAYNEIIQQQKEKCQWIAFIDTDEFLFPTHKKSLPEFLKDYEEFGGICVSWRLYGTSYVDKIPPNRSMLEMLTLAAQENYHSFHKSIVNPRRVQRFNNAHAASYQKPFFHVDPNKNQIEDEQMRSQGSLEKIRINHYWTRDITYFLETKLKCRDRRGWSLFNDLTRAAILNECYDPSILRWIPYLPKKPYFND